MLSKTPIPRSPRNVVSPVAAKMPRRWPVWIVRTVWALLGATLTIAVTFLSQGPDAIRRLPEIPKAALETAAKVVEEVQINRALTTFWVAGPLQSGGVEGSFGLELDMTCGERECGAAFTSPAMKTWSPLYGIVNFHGLRQGKLVTGKVFDWVDNERVDIAVIRIQFQADDLDGLSDHVPPLVEEILKVQVLSQIAPVLPLTFDLRRKQP